MDFKCRPLQSLKPENAVDDGRYALLSLLVCVAGGKKATSYREPTSVDKRLPASPNDRHIRLGGSRVGERFVKYLFINRPVMNTRNCAWSLKNRCILAVVLRNGLVGNDI